MRPVIFFLFIYSMLNGQTVQVIKIGAYANKTIPQGYDLIEEETDTSKLFFVATLKAVGKNNNTGIPDLYYALKNKATSMGANCYKLSDFNDSLRILSINVYVVTDSTLRMNSLLHERNCVYIIGNDSKSSKTYTFNLNGEKKTIPSGTYFKHCNQEGQEVKINKGGIVGSTVWIKWADQKQATFLALSGIRVGNPSSSSYNRSPLTVSFRAGGLHYIDNDLGYLLAKILVENNG